MEDPWANAWGEPAKPKQSWSHSAQSSTDAETDIAMPSWGSGSAANWSEPSPDQETLWQPSEPAKGWASTYDDLPLGKPDTVPVPDTPVSLQVPETTGSSPAVSPSASPEPTSEHAFPAQEPEIESPSPAPRSSSPDAYGTFESGLEADDPWAAASVASPDTAEQVNVWVPSWGAPDHESDKEEDPKPVDEWEEAKRQKARQDQHVPPEFLASIIGEFSSLSNDLWPPRSPTTNFSEARSGMERVEGLNSIANRLVPHDLNLPSHVPFSKTFTAKRMGDSLRLSRHVPLTRLSPFTMYMASKGSTSWESSVKSRIDISNDDLLPPGWRVVEKDEEGTAPAVDPKKKTTGGFLSFFGRKPYNASVENNPRRSESPGRTPSISTSAAQSIPAQSSPMALQSTRPSLDGAKSPVRSSTPALLGSLPSPSSSLAHTAALPTSQNPAPEVFEQPQAPSAVSRFFTRFSRNKTGPGSQESLALSTDDLEFLDDIVPSANDHADEADQLRGLTNLLSASPSATALPPLLPAPPRLPPSNIVSEKFPALPSATPIVNTNDDLFSIFDSAPMTSKPTMTTTQLSILSLLPPQLPPTSIQPTNTFRQTESQGPTPLPRDLGRSSSPFDTSASTLRSHTPSSSRRAPVAIMSTGSSPAGRSGSNINLPPPPILPPPPLSKPITPSHSRAPSQHKLFKDDDNFTSFHSSPTTQPSLLADTINSSKISDQSLFSDTSSLRKQAKNDFFDDFDEFVSSPMRDSSSPRPPAKPSSLRQTPIVQIAAERLPQSTLPQPPVKHPPPPSRRADHQRTSSLVNIAAARTGKWPGPPSPLPDPLPPPGALQAVSTSTMKSGSSPMQPPQKNGTGVTAANSSTSAFPLFPPPPSFSGVRTTTMSPSPPPPLLTASPVPVNRILHNGRTTSPAPPLAKYTPIPTPAASGGLSAQDLSFFEGL
ncbi:hypothetical protein H0H87_007515 [Tephrocybe sp. NHM501043]|nr:hypothetical protein H0H87_007515 [Tephrocybe sp. NHM501043]